MTDYKLTYHIKRKVAFQARDLKHAQAMAKSVVNTIHRGIDENDYIILEISKSNGKKDDAEDEIEPDAARNNAV